jgi:gliding motility-associated-like protein
LPWGTVVNNTGIYQDTLRTVIGCDSLVRRINLNVNQVPTLTAIKANDINCTTGSAQLFVFGASQYQWTPATGLNDPTSPRPIASPTSTTQYFVQGTDVNGCVNHATITVNVNFTGQGTYYLPNSFTPNGDGLNDCFGIRYFGQISQVSFTIYNRYGEKVFYTNIPTGCWNGYYKGNIANQGNYVYYIKAVTACGIVERKGNLILLR